MANSIERPRGTQVAIAQESGIGVRALLRASLPRAILGLGVLQVAPQPARPAAGIAGKGPGSPPHAIIVGSGAPGAGRPGGAGPGAPRGAPAGRRRRGRMSAAVPDPLAEPALCLGLPVLRAG